MEHAIQQSATAGSRCTRSPAWANEAAAAKATGLHTAQTRQMLRLAAVACVAAMTLTGCARVPAGPAQSAAETVNNDDADVGALRPGNYPTQPRPSRGRAESKSAGARYEGQRMAAKLVGPWEVDPTLTRVISINTAPLESASALWVDFPKTVRDIAAKHGYLTGFSSSRGAALGAPTRFLTNAVLRFPYEEAASSAATAMAAEQMRVWPDNPAVASSIPGRAGSIALARSGIGVNGQPTAVVQAFTSHGPYVLYQWVELEDGSGDDATALVARTLDLALPRIDAFHPTEAQNFANLPTDPLDLLSRTLPPEAHEVSHPAMGSYPPAAALHFETDPTASSRLFEAAGVDAVAMTNNVVYRTRDSEAAQLIADLAARQFSSGATNDRRTAPVPGLSKSQCFDRRTDDVTMRSAQLQFYCVATAGNYAFKTSSQQLGDAHQRAAAQYLLLVAP